MKSNKNVGLLIIFLMITVVMAMLFLPSINEGVQAGMAGLTELGEMDGVSQTIFDSINYTRSIHILAMLLLGFGFFKGYKAHLCGARGRYGDGEICRSYQGDARD